MISSNRSAHARAGVGVREQVAHAQLEVGEVDGGASRLRGVERRAEAVEQVVEQDQRGPRVVVGARRPVRLPRLAVAGARLVLERLGAAAELGDVELARPRHGRGSGAEPLAGLQRLARGGHLLAVGGAGEGGGGRGAGGGERRGIGIRQRRRDRQPRMGLAAAAQCLVRAEDEVGQGRAVGGGEVERRRAARRGPGLERGLVRALGEPPGGRLVEHREARIEARRQRPGAQHAGAEAVDRADPRRLGLARALELAERGQPPAQALAQLAGRLLGEGEREHRADRHAVVQDGLDEPLDHHGGLAGARGGGEQRRPGAVVDRRPLLGREPDARRPGRPRGEGGHAAAPRSSRAAGAAPPFSPGPPSPARQIAG